MIEKTTDLPCFGHYEEDFLNDYTSIDEKLFRKNASNYSTIFVDKERFRLHLKHEVLIIIDKVELTINNENDWSKS